MHLETAKLHQRLGTTMVHVTHDQVEALTLADRIVVLDAGVVQQVGTPMKLYKKPANPFVARFIGSPTMNLMVVSMYNYTQVPGAGRLLCRCTGNTPLEPEAPIGLQLGLSHVHLFNVAGLALTHQAA